MSGDKQTRLIKTNSFMRFCTVIIIFVFISINTACSTSANEADENKLAAKIPEHSILIPTYSTTIGSFSAGTTFVAEVEGEKIPYVITAHHVFGPLGGLPKEVEVYNLPNFIEGVKFNDAFNEDEVNISIKAISIPEERRGGSAFKTDLTVFELSGGDKIKALKLSYKPLKKGERIWLATSLEEGAPKTQKLHEAEVLSTDAKEIRFTYKDKDIKLTGTSGSPILNDRLEVVGVNLGRKTKGGAFGVANPSISIKNFLDELKKQ